MNHIRNPFLAQIAAAFACVFGQFSAHAVPSPELVKDIWTTLNPGGSSPADFTVVGSSLFFTATDTVHGKELWKTDGTAEGTVLVKDINPGAAGSYPGSLVVIGGALYFGANDGANGYELWKSDGTEDGTVLFKDILPGSGNGAPALLTAVNSTLYFRAYGAVTGYALWKSDGTAAGTTLLKDVTAGSGGSGFDSLTAVGDALYFRAVNGSNGSELWRSDGTGAGTAMVKDIYPGSTGSFPDELIDVAGTLFFVASDSTNGRELWKSDGTPAGTVMVKNTNPSSGGYSPARLTAVGNALYFIADDGINGLELWKSDGTEFGTAIVKVIQTPTGSFAPQDLTAVGNTLFFAADDGINGFELWKTDGSAAGTVLVKDINPGSERSLPNNLFAIGSTLYFSAAGSGSDFELWKSDGTEAGTVIVKDIDPGAGHGSPSKFAAIGSAIYFVANDGIHGGEVWKSDGTEAGTGLVKDIWTEGGSSVPGQFTLVGGTIFFAATDETHGRELWKSDGTEAGTVLVKDINAGTGSSQLDRLSAMGSTLYFVATNGTNGAELWKSDGTEAGTTMVADIAAGAAGSNPDGLTAISGTVFFGANNGVNGAELWKSDGTQAGTVLVKDINPGSNSSEPQDFAVVGSTLYFSANNGTAGEELWKSDGSAAGTVLVKDINAGANGSFLFGLTAMSGTVYFTAYTSTTGYELWKTNGTTAGTVMVKEINSGSAGYAGPNNLTVVGNTLFFVGDNQAYGKELWKTDGTAGGTVLVKDINPSSWSSPFNLTAFGNTLYFQADDGIHGKELWKSDGTAVGTVLVKDINAGSGDGGTGRIAALGATLYFTADNGINGAELWRSDGTAAGTEMVADISGDSLDSASYEVVAGGVKIFFSAKTQNTGTEFYVYDPAVDPRPVLTLAGPNPLTLEASVESYTDPGGTAIDIVDGALTPVISASNLNLAVPGTYQVTLTVTDKGGLTDSAVRTVTVQDTTPPALGNTFFPLSIVAGTLLPDYTTQAAATDIVGVAAVTQSPLPGTVVSMGNLEVSISARDSANNQSSVSFTVAVTSASPTCTLLYSKGEAVPGAGETGSGIPAGSLWKTFGVPSINNVGTRAFVASTSSPTGSVTRIFKAADGSTQFGIVAETKQPAPGLPAGVLFSGFKDPLLNARGDIAFVANLSGTGVTSASNQALFVKSTDGDSDRLIAREGTQAADAPDGALWRNFNSVAFANESAAGGAWTLAISASMVTGPLGVAGPGGVSRTDDTGLWLADATRTLLAIREGQTLAVGTANKTVKSFYALKAMGGAAGQGLGASTAGVPVQVAFTDSTQALLRVTLSDPEADAGVLIETLALTGDAIPGLDVSLKKLGLPAQSGSGDATVWISSLDTRVNSQAIVRADSAGGISSVARKGGALSATAGAPTFSSFTSVAVNEEGDYAVLAKLTGPGVTSASDLALTRRIGAQPWEVIAREGTMPPGTTAGSQWATFPSYAIADDGATVAFLGKLKVPKIGEPNPANVTNANDVGLWVALPGEEPQLLLREGDVVEGKTVRSFTALTAISGSPAQRRTFTPDGRALLIRVNATDGSQHMIIIRVPAPQKPREPA